MGIYEYLSKPPPGDFSLEFSLTYDTELTKKSQVTAYRALDDSRRLTCNISTRDAQRYHLIGTILAFLLEYVNEFTHQLTTCLSSFNQFEPDTTVSL